MKTQLRVSVFQHRIESEDGLVLVFIASISFPNAIILQEVGKPGTPEQLPEKRNTV